LFTSWLLALPLSALLAAAAPTPPPTLTLKDGRVFELKSPPRHEAGRIVFTTTEGKTYTLNESEVKSFVGEPPAPTRGPSTYNPQDSRALGAIARQERANTGKTTDLSTTASPPRSTRPPKKTPTAKRTKSPRPTRTPTRPPA
jgi:hypothetical protein